MRVEPWCGSLPGGCCGRNTCIIICLGTSCAGLPIRAIYGTGEPFTRVGGRVRVFLSSTWGRADQQTSRDSNRVWGVLFCGENPFLAAPFVPAHSTSEPFTGFQGRVRVFLSSTWGRADQQTSQDSNRVGGVLFCAQLSCPASCRFQSLAGLG